MGKGSTRRPNFVPLSELAARWDATFGTEAEAKDAALSIRAERFPDDFTFTRLPTPSPAPDVEA